MKLHYEKTRQITPSNAQTALVDLQLGAVALCNEGANSRADIILMKGKVKKNMPKTYEELLKALQPEQSEILTKHFEKLEADKDDVIKGLNAQIETLNGTIADLQKKVPAADEDITKGMTPEVKALFEKQQKTIDGLLSAQAEDLAKSRFEKCKAIPCDEETLKSILKSASPAVVEVLEKAAAAIEDSLLTAKGRDADPAFVGGTADEQYGKLEKSAKDIMAANEGMTFEQAFMKAVEADPETYRKYTEGVK